MSSGGTFTRPDEVWRDAEDRKDAVEDHAATCAVAERVVNDGDLERAAGSYLYSRPVGVLVRIPA